MAKAVIEQDLDGGGGRGGGAVARFTSQLVALVVPDRKDRVVALSERHGVSQATIMRTIVEHGLPLVEQKLADGSIDPTTLA